MDIEYLLYLQQFRETVGSILTPLMNAVTKLSAGFLPIAMMCMIYWAFDRKGGTKNPGRTWGRSVYQRIFKAYFLCLSPMDTGYTDFTLW